MRLHSLRSVHKKHPQHFAPSRSILSYGNKVSHTTIKPWTQFFWLRSWPYNFCLTNDSSPQSCDSLTHLLWQTRNPFFGMSGSLRRYSLSRTDSFRPVSVCTHEARASIIFYIFFVCYATTVIRKEQVFLENFLKKSGNNVTVHRQSYTWKWQTVSGTACALDKIQRY